MKLYKYLSEKYDAFACTPLEIQVFRYLCAIEVCKLAKNNPCISLPPAYKKLIIELDL